MKKCAIRAYLGTVWSNLNFPKTCVWDQIELEFRRKSQSLAVLSRPRV